MMEPEKINHPYLTAIKRTDFSVPTRYLMQHKLLKGKILDFGCGFGFDTDELKKQGYDISDEIITEDECVQALYGLLKGKQE